MDACAAVPGNVTFVSTSIFLHVPASIRNVSKIVLLTWLLLFWQFVSCQLTFAERKLDASECEVKELQPWKSQQAADLPRLNHSSLREPIWKEHALFYGNSSCLFALLSALEAASSDPHGVVVIRRFVGPVILLAQSCHMLFLYDG